MDWHQLQERYIRDEWPVRLGNLASSLARIASATDDPRTLSRVPPSVRECMLLIEWNVHRTPSEILIELAPMQTELGLWQQSWNAVAQFPALQMLLARRAREMSDRVLQLSGLLNRSSG